MILIPNELIQHPWNDPQIIVLLRSVSAKIESLPNQSSHYELELEATHRDYVCDIEPYTFGVDDDVPIIDVIELSQSRTIRIPSSQVPDVMQLYNADLPTLRSLWLTGEIVNYSCHMHRYRQ